MEKIIIQPESVRGLGNVAEQKVVDDFSLYNCILSEDTDVINNVEFVTFVSEGAAGELSVLSLSASSASISIGGTSTLTATLTDGDDSPISGATITFKEGSTTLGTDTTNSSGVASYTYTGAVTGSHNLSALFTGDSTYAPSTASTSITVNKLSTSTALSSSGVNVQVGTNVTLTATVTSSSTPVEGLTVTFKDGTATLGTGTTNSSGVATYSTSSLSVATHSITAVTTETDTYSTSTSSAVSVTVYDHLYSLAFSQSSYTATGGTATLECTLLDNNVPVEGATISVTGSDSSLYTGITDSTGTASVTVSVSATTTFTASYSNVSANCTVNVQSLLFYDACNTTYDSSKYGTIIKVSSSTTTNYTAYDSTNNCYKTRANGDWGVLPITALASADNYKIEALFKRPSSNATYQGGFSFANPTNPNSTCFVVRMRGDGKVDYCQRDNTETTVATSLGSAWIKIELTVQGQSIGIKVYDGTTLKASTTATNPLSNTVIGLHLVGGSSYGFYVKEIKAESL